MNEEMQAELYRTLGRIEQKIDNHFTRQERINKALVARQLSTEKKVGRLLTIASVMSYPVTLAAKLVGKKVGIS